MLTVTQQNRYVFECACMFVQCVLWGEGVWQGWGGGAAVDVLTACSHFCCVSPMHWKPLECVMIFIDIE